MRSTDTEITVAVAGLGAAGLPVARWLDRGVPGLRLTAVAASSPDRARTLTQDFEVAPLAVPLADLPRHADVIVEALPPARFRDVADPAIEAGRTLIILSLTQLLAHMQLIDRARETGARIIAASGAIAGLDAVRAAAMGGAGRAVLQTRKPLAVALPMRLSSARRGLIWLACPNRYACFRAMSQRRRRNSRRMSMSRLRWRWPDGAPSRRVTKSGPIPGSPATPTRS